MKIKSVVCKAFPWILSFTISIIFIHTFSNKFNTPLNWQQKSNVIFNAITLQKNQTIALQPTGQPMSEPATVKKSLTKDEVAARNRKRLARVKQYCNHIKDPNQLYKDPYFSFRDTTVNRKYKLLWKRTPKCGYNTWVSHLIKLGGAGPNLFPTDLNATDFLDTWRRLVDEGYLTFVFVRHPFDRLISGYRNKLEDGVKNITLFHGNLFRTEPWWAGMSKRIATQYGNGTGNVFCTFAQFVAALLDGKMWTDHWAPLSNLIYPCELKYDVIGKVETFKEDTDYILYLRNATAVDTNKKLNMNSPTSRDKFFSTLSKEQVHGLYKAFEEDFQMFDYNLDNYKKYM